ncbi:uncharacterized protein LOC126380514 [Pectinophora gossypiella]|uniref:uncharacterized protein LOC126380514 n=1 Tax=Pectinophora gossypiella TaxID=13191 RepID=UPI00214E70EF|nr:uncharacterized protein LOC126380514 [Pectinophora gossypiella]
MSAVSIKYLPLEMVEKILQNLDVDDLKICSRVCLMWQDLAKDIVVNKMKEACKTVLGAHYMETYVRANMSWEQIFASLLLWKEIKSLRMSVNSSPPLHTLCAFISDERRIPRLQLLENGIVAFPQFMKTNDAEYDWMVHLGYFNAVSYYNITTLELIKTQVFQFAFCMYAENDFLIVFVTRQFEVKVFSKINQQLHTIGKLHTTANFYLTEKTIFFKAQNNVVHMVSLVTENDEVMLNSIAISRDNFSEEIKAVTTINENRIDLITQKGHIYAVSNHSNCDYKINYICHIDKNTAKEPGFLNVLKRHGFDWSAPDVYKWIKEDCDAIWPLHTGLNHSTVKVHGNVLLIGTSRRVLEIYVDPYSNGVLKLQGEKPVQKIIMPRHISRSRNEIVAPPYGIVQIEVLEILDGHRIIMLYDKRLVVINFKKIPKRQAGVMASCSAKKRSLRCSHCEQRALLWCHAGRTLHPAEFPLRHSALLAQQAATPLHHVAQRRHHAALWGHHTSRCGHFTAPPTHHGPLARRHAPFARLHAPFAWPHAPLFIEYPEEPAK